MSSESPTNHDMCNNNTNSKDNETKDENVDESNDDNDNDIVRAPDDKEVREVVRVSDQQLKLSHQIILNRNCFFKNDNFSSNSFWVIIANGNNNNDIIFLNLIHLERRLSANQIY